LLLPVAALLLALFFGFKKDSIKDEDVKIKLPEGFSSSTFATKLGKARHMAISPNGDVYVKLERLSEGKGIVQLRDKNGDGVADENTKFGEYTGTGIAIKNGYLYASSNESVFRYAMDASGNVIDPRSPERIVTGLVNKLSHASKSLTLDNDGNIYVNIGAPSNVCQDKSNAKDAPVLNPCPLLENSGGIWQFRVDKKDQSYGEGVRYATGLRNVVGLDWNNEVNALYVSQHGRDLLYQYFPEMYDSIAGAENPAEELFRIKKGSDCGWPYCYYDNDRKKKLLNPEYGGNREKAGVCADKEQSVMQFPGHMAPNAILFYTGNQFPARYKNGVFIAFHGSWNRAPRPQAGYFVVFLPMKNGVPSGPWEVFADGFAGENINRAKYRPCGLAQGIDGSLYVSDDNVGNIWKISYKK
jgi:glucose/arabinose dehydrogenase